jgi:hypothetical protein
MFALNKLSLGISGKRRSPLVRLRNFLDFDPVLNSYGELATAWTPTGNFEAGLNFSTTSSAAQTLFGGELAGTDEIRLEINTSGFVVASAYVGTALQTAITSTVALDNGKFHSAKIVYTGTTADLIVNGISIGTQTWALNGSQTIKYVGRLSTGAYFNGVPANPVLTDVTTPANSQAYNLDQATGTTESSTVNSGTLTYNNIPEANRFQAQLIGTDWLGTAELVANGTFDSGSDWSLQSGVTISGSKLVIDSSTTFAPLATQNLSLADGGTFRLGATASGYVQGTVNIRQGTAGSGNIIEMEANGDFTQQFVGIAASTLGIRSSGGDTEANLDTLSIKWFLEAPPLLTPLFNSSGVMTCNGVLSCSSIIPCGV